MKNNGDLKDIDEAIELFNQRDARKDDPNKGNENKIINYNGSIFSEDEIDPSELIDNSRRRKEAISAADNFPKSKTKLEKQQEKRELEKQRQILLAKQREARKKHFKKIIATILTGSTVIAGSAYAAAKIVPKIENNMNRV